MSTSGPRRTHKGAVPIRGHPVRERRTAVSKTDRQTDRGDSMQGAGYTGVGELKEQKGRVTYRSVTAGSGYHC